MSDPYDRKEEALRNNYREHRDKILNPKRIVTTSPGKNGLFSSPRGGSTSGPNDLSGEKTGKPPLFGPFRPNNPAK